MLPTCQYSRHFTWKGNHPESKFRTPWTMSTESIDKTNIKDIGFCVKAVLATINAFLDALASLDFTLVSKSVSRSVVVSNLK